MADTKISAAGDAGVLISTDMVPLARSGNVNAFRATMAEVAAYTNTSIPAASSTTPIMDGTAAIGSGTTYARADHVHPTDTSRYAATNPNGYQTAAQVTTALAPYAPLASPPFTGNPTAPTPAYGDNDTSIPTTAFVQSAVAPVANNVGRNLVTNGTFVVQQRGAGPFTTNNTYTLDRWYIGAGHTGGGSGSVTPYAMVDTDRTAIADQSAMFAIADAFTGGTGASDQDLVGHLIEDVRRLGGKTVTISFWARCLAGALKTGVGLYQNFGSGGSPSAGVTVNATAVTLSTTWTRYSVTLAVPSIIGKTTGTNNNSNTELDFYFSAGSSVNAAAGGIGVQSGTIQLWGVQLEIGSVATALDAGGTPQQILAECQRFFVQLRGVNAMLYGQNAGFVGAPVTWPATMRAAPTLTFSNVTYSNASAVNGSTTTTGMMYYYTVTTQGVGQATADVAASADL